MFSSFGRRSVVKALVAGLMFAGVSSGVGNAQEAKTLRVTVQPGTGSLPFRVALEKGFFEKRGIKLEVTQGNDQTAYIQALDRQFDVIMLTVTTGIQAVAAGADIKGFAGMEALNDNVLTNVIITNKPGIETLADLAREGGTVALPRVTDLLKWILEYNLRKSNQAVDKLHYVAVPFPEMPDQLRSGRVAAIFSAAGFFEPLLDEGFRVIFKYPNETLVAAGAKLPLTWAHFGSSTKFADENPETIVKFQEAIAEASAWIAANNDEARKIYAEWIGAKPEAVSRATIPFYKAEYTQADVAAWLPVLTEGGLLNRPVDPASFIPTVFAGK